MPYATVADLITRFGEPEIEQLAGRTALDVIDAEVAERALADAAAEIDSYVGARYRLPFDPVPPLLGRLACDIARYRLYDDAAPEEIRRRYEDAVKLLTRIADGTVSFGVAVDAPTAPNEVVLAQPAQDAAARRRAWGGLL